MTTINIADDWLDTVRASLGRAWPTSPVGSNRPCLLVTTSSTTRRLLRSTSSTSMRWPADDRGTTRLCCSAPTAVGGSASIGEVSRSRSPTCCRCSIISACVRSTSVRSASPSTAPRCGSTMWVSPYPPMCRLTDAIRAEVQCSFLAEFDGSIEVDGLNRLVMLGGLTARQIEILRAYSRYLRQIGFPFSQQYIESTLVRHASISRLLAALVQCAVRSPCRRRHRRHRNRFARRDRRSARRGAQSRRRSHAAFVRRRSSMQPCAPTRTGPQTRRLSRPVLSFKFDTSQGSRPAATASDVRDLGVLAAGRGRAPARRAHRPRRHPLERSSGGLPHGDPRA